MIGSLAVQYISTKKLATHINNSRVLSRLDIVLYPIYERDSPTLPGNA